MYPTIPFTTVRDRAIDQDGMRDLAAQRDLPLRVQQRRDDAGRFVSHSDIPEKTA